MSQYKNTADGELSTVRAFSFAGLLVWALMDLQACGTGIVENNGCILPLDFPE